MVSVIEGKVQRYSQRFLISGSKNSRGQMTLGLSYINLGKLSYYLVRSAIVLFCFFKEFLKFIYLFYFLFLAVLGLRCCTRAFSSCGERGATLRCGAWASHWVASLVAEHGL